MKSNALLRIARFVLVVALEDIVVEVLWAMEVDMELADIREKEVQGVMWGMVRYHGNFVKFKRFNLFSFMIISMLFDFGK